MYTFPPAPVPRKNGGKSMERSITNSQTAARPRTKSARAELPEERAKGHSRKKVDLTGQRYGKLTVIAPAENVGGRTAWLCRCDCGRETVARTHRLRNGHTVSCGCLSAGRGAGLPGLTYIDGTCVEMLAAKTVRRNNTSGVPGVDWLSSKQRWRAMICFKGKRHYLGSYARFEDAVKARKRAEEEFHDKFLREYAKEAGPGGGAGDGDSDAGSD